MNKMNKDFNEIIEKIDQKRIELQNDPNVIKYIDNVKEFIDKLRVYLESEEVKEKKDVFFDYLNKESQNIVSNFNSLIDSNERLKNVVDKGNSFKEDLKEQFFKLKDVGEDKYQEIKEKVLTEDIKRSIDKIYNTKIMLSIQIPETKKEIPVSKRYEIKDLITKGEEDEKNNNL